MELLHTDPTVIWRLLIPPSLWMFPEDVPQDELIFQYRDYIYFVNGDGSVLSMAKPSCSELMGLGTLLELLAASDETFDYDDNGEFDFGYVLQRMGYLVSTKREREKADYMIEIVNTIAPQVMVTRYELKRISFTFALYHALMRCHELNKRSDWEFEHEVKRITKIERYIAKDLQFQH